MKLGTYVLLFLVLSVGTIISGEIAARDEQVDTFEVVEIEQPHAWCYVLKNDQHRLVGDINLLSCVPKGTTERKPNLLSPDRDMSGIGR